MQTISNRFGAWLTLLAAACLSGCAVDAQSEEQAEASLGEQEQAVHSGTGVTVGEEATYGLARLPGTTCSAVVVLRQWALTLASCGNLKGKTLRFQGRIYNIDASFIHPSYQPLGLPPPQGPVLARYNLQLLRLDSELLAFNGSSWNQPFNTLITTTAQGLVGTTLRCFGAPATSIETRGEFRGGSVLSTGILQLTSTGQYLETTDRGGPCFTISSSTPPLLVALSTSGYSSRPPSGQVNAGTANAFNRELWNWTSTKVQQNPPPL